MDDHDEVYSVEEACKQYGLNPKIVIFVAAQIYSEIRRTATGRFQFLKGRPPFEEILFDKTDQDEDIAKTFVGIALLILKNHDDLGNLLVRHPYREEQQ